MEKTTKSCSRCSHYGCLINQGMWWCNNGHTDNMDAENCEDYDDAYAGAIMTSFSSTTTIQDIQPPAPMARYKLIRAKRKRRTQRTIKHGKRNI